MKVITTIVTCWCIVLNTHSQTLPEDFNLERMLDELFPVQDENFDYAELYENYAQRILNPLNLNIASEEELRSLSILNTTQIHEFMKYREENGPILSIYELQVIPSFTQRVIDLIRPFVVAEDSRSAGWKGLINRMVKEDNNYLVSRIERTVETKAGYTDSATPSNQYHGAPLKIYNRYRTSSSGDFSLGFTAEKDGGEQMKWSPSNHQLGFDFLSAHVQVQNKGFLKNLVIGDYQAQFGQGLTMGGGFGMGKGSETITTMRRSNLGFLPYTSVTEFGYLRGISMSIALGKLFTLHPFYSRSRRDGNSSASENEEATVSSLLLSGLHRTTNEINFRKNISETNLGSVLQFQTTKTDAGIIFHRTSFSTPVLRDPSLYNQFAFNGTSNANLGLYWNQSINNFSFFSEVAHSINHGTAGVAGVLVSLNQHLDIALHYRHFEKDYYSFYSNAISESTTPQNEEGMYGGWKYRISKQHSISGYIDLFRFPWLRFRSYRPSEGNEWLLRYSYTPNKSVQFFAQMRQEKKVRNLSEDTPNYTTAPGTKTNYWLNADYKVGNYLTFKTRVQYITFEIESYRSNGLALIQDLNLHWKKFTISSRIALFDTDDYDTRLYVYEKDAWLSFTIPALQGIGLREYILLHYNVSRKIDLWLRWAKTEYENQEAIGSGGELINGNQKTDLKAQVRLRF